MEQPVAQTALTVRVRTPVHVGTGERMKGFHFVQQGQSIVVLSEQKLLRWAEQTPENADLMTTLAEQAAQHENIAELFRGKMPSPEKFAAYRLRVSHGEPREVFSFIKTPDHRPYLPGSSLKGAVRSGLLRGVVGPDQKLRQDLTRAAEPLVSKGSRAASEHLEALVFVAPHTDRKRHQNYDLLRTLGFADTDPVAVDKLEVFEIHILSSQSGGEDDGGRGPARQGTAQHLAHKQQGRGVLSFHVEALRPDTVLQGTVLWNWALLDDPAAAPLGLRGKRGWVSDFCGVCRLAAIELVEQELKFLGMHQARAVASSNRHLSVAELLRQHGEQRADPSGGLIRFYEKLRAELAAMQGAELLWPLGFGTGYDAKTVTDLLSAGVFGQVAKNYRNTRRLGRPSGQDRWMGPDMSPKSRKVVVYKDGKVEPLGWLHIKLQET